MDEQRKQPGRRLEDFEAHALRQTVATHNALITRMRIQIAALERDIERVLAHQKIDPATDFKALRGDLAELKKAFEEYLK
jgi:hypothetical protein